MQTGMIGRFVPHEICPPGRACDPKLPPPFAELAPQKGLTSLSLCTLHRILELRERFKANSAETEGLDRQSPGVRSVKRGYRFGREAISSSMFTSSVGYLPV